MTHPQLIKAANIITRTSHYESFTMSGTGYIRDDRPARGQQCQNSPNRLRALRFGSAECSTARAGNRRFWLLSALRAHTKTPIENRFT